MRFPRPILLALAVTAACNRDDAAPAVDTARRGEPAPAIAARPLARVSGWNDAAGALMIVADSVPDAAIVVVPDATEDAVEQGPGDAAEAQGARLELFSRAGRVGAATVATVRIAAGAGAGATGTAVDTTMPDEACTAWPGAALRLEGAPAGWTVAFLEGRVVGLPLDSIASWPAADSARTVASIARIASGLPGDTASAFRGLPFYVKDVWRLKDGEVDILVAKVLRRLGQEANPREQHLLLVAERDSSGAWVPAFVERSSGPEETVETFDVLAAVALGPARTTTLVLSRDTDAGGVFVLLERTGAREWKARWTSAYAGC